MGGESRYKKAPWILSISGVLMIIATLSCAQNRVQPDAGVTAPVHTAAQDVNMAAGAADSKIEPNAPNRPQTVIQTLSEEYTLGVEDVIQIDLLKPESLTTLTTVAPDGFITFPYIGNVLVKDRTIAQVQEEIQARLAKGYMKYPVVSVLLRESRSRKFFVYGEVYKPGSYLIEENMTALRAISMAGGFTRFGSSSRVKVLRSKKDGPGYDTMKVNIKAVMEGDSDEDLVLTQGDIVVVSEGIF